MDTKTMKKLAEQFDELAGQIIAIGGTFRAASGGGKGAAGDDAPAGKGAAKSGAKAPAGKPAKGGKGGKAEAEEITEDSLRERLKELAATKGKEVMAEALAHVDASRLPDVDDDEYEKLNDKITELMEAEEETKPAHDFAKLTKRFNKLDDDDKATVLKACGVKKFAAIDEDDEDEVNTLAEALDEV